MSVMSTSNDEHCRDYCNQPQSFQNCHVVTEMEVESKHALITPARYAAQNFSIFQDIFDFGLTNEPFRWNGLCKLLWKFEVGDRRSDNIDVRCCFPSVTGSSWIGVFFEACLFVCCRCCTVPGLTFSLDVLCFLCDIHYQNPINSICVTHEGRNPSAFLTHTVSHLVESQLALSKNRIQNWIRFFYFFLLNYKTIKSAICSLYEICNCSLKVGLGDFFSDFIK